MRIPTSPSTVLLPILFPFIFFLLFSFLLLFFFLPLFSLPVSAQLNTSREDLSVYDELTLNFSMLSNFTVIEEKPTAVLKSMQTDLLFYPYSSNQQNVLSLGTPRPFERIDGIYDQGFRFNWLGYERDYTFGFTSRLNVKNKALKVTNKIVFPVLDIPDDARRYLEATPLIDYKNNGVQPLASRLVAGEDDLYVVVFTLADWVRNNIKYDLNTATADASLPASWVLEHKQGVCDEMTNLFLAMLRSVGVPARFVTGVSYTTSDLFQQPWGPHGWAEVYFPGVGWVPFDVTYGQYGFLDATHIKLKHSVDSNKSSVEYQWMGRDVRVVPNKILMNVSVASRGAATSDDDVAVSLHMYDDHVKIGSYNLVQVVLKNNHPYYHPVNLRLSKSEKLTVFDKPERAVLLKPGEEKTFFWMVRVDDDLDRDYAYTFTLRLDMIGRPGEMIQFIADRKGTLYSLQDVDAVVTANEDADEKVYSQNIALSCSPELETGYHGASVPVHCVVQNRGNTLQQNVAVCLLTNCEMVNLGIGEEKSVSLLYLADATLGDKQLEVTARNKEVLKSSFFSLHIIDQPILLINNLQYPLNASLSTGNFTLSFVLIKDSASVPENVDVSVNYGSKTYEATMSSLENSMPVTVIIDPSDLLFEHNTIPIEITYEDSLGGVYHTNERAIITFIPENVETRFSFFLNKILMFFDGLVKK